MAILAWFCRLRQGTMTWPWCKHTDSGRRVRSATLPPGGAFTRIYPHTAPDCGAGLRVMEADGRQPLQAGSDVGDVVGRELVRYRTHRRGGRTIARRSADVQPLQFAGAVPVLIWIKAAAAGCCRLTGILLWGGARHEPRSFRYDPV